MQISVSVDFKSVLDELTGEARRRAGYVAARTVNKLATDAADFVKQRMQDDDVFDKPVAFTLKGVRSQAKATPNELVSAVYIAGTEDGAGKSERDYLRPEAYGTAARHQKRSEALLSRNGFLPPGWVTVPGRYIMNGRLDSNGNMPGSYYKQIIRELLIKNTKGPPKPRFKGAVTRAAKMGVDSEFFAVAPGKNALAKGGGWLPPGVYRRVGPGGRQVVQYLKFVRKASYKVRLDMHKEVQTSVTANAQKRWDESVGFIVERFSRGR